MKGSGWWIGMIIAAAVCAYGAYYLMPWK